MFVYICFRCLRNYGFEFEKCCQNCKPVVMEVILVLFFIFLCLVFQSAPVLIISKDYGLRIKVPCDVHWWVDNTKAEFWFSILDDVTYVELWDVVRGLQWHSDLTEWRIECRSYPSRAIIYAVLYQILMNQILDQPWGWVPTINCSIALICK